MPRRAAFVSLALVLVGCPSEPPPPDPAPPEPPGWCDDGRAELLLTGRRTDPIGVWPDDHWVLPDARTRTGLRVHLEPSQSPGLLSTFPAEWSSILDDVSTLDGWGLTAGIAFRFRFSVAPASLTPDAVGLVVFEGEVARHVPVEITTTSFPDTVILRPRVPLPAGAQAAAALFADVTSSDGSCLRQPPHLRELLSPQTELAPGVPAHVLADRYRAAMDAFGNAPADIAAMTVFTTQSTPMESLAVVQDVRSRSYALDGPMACAPASGGHLRCEGTIEVMDYRGADSVTPVDFDGTPSGSYALPVTITLPVDRQGPSPVVLLGHGLASDRHRQGGAVEELAALGMAVVATDAVQHGDHPTRTSGTGTLEEVLTFFALETSPTPLIHPRVLRDNFRQSTWDRLQVLEAVHAGIDADGDGAVDLDADRLVYFGASLGGMMGSETMALSDRFLGGAISITGGRITQVVTESPVFGPLLDLMIPDGWGADDLARFIPLVQTVADGGDPMVWAAHVVRDRLVGDPAAPPQLLSQYLRDDEVVNNVSNRNHAAALGVPGVGRELWEMPDVSWEAGPVQGNLPNGGTAALHLLDEGRPQDEPEAVPAPLAHADAPGSYEAWSVWAPFLLDAIAGEPAVVFDPYAE